jgi:hypothetical protein
MAARLAKLHLSPDADRCAEAPGKQMPHSLCKPDLTLQADPLETAPQHAHDFPCWPGTGQDPGPLV